MKHYHDRKSNVQASILKDPVKIVKTKGSMITAQQETASLLETAPTSRKLTLNHYYKVIQMTRIQLVKMVVNWLKIVLKKIMPPVHQTHLRLERLTMTCPVQDLYHHPLESQQECPKDQPDLLRQCNFY